MLQQREYEVLRGLLEAGNFQTPILVHRTLTYITQGTLTCHLVAMQAGIETGEPPVLGVHFLDLHGKLFPWAHAVNSSQMGLVDYSQDRIVLPDFGFAKMGWDRFVEWRNIMAAYRPSEVTKSLPSWGDPLADALSEQFLPILRTKQN